MVEWKTINRNGTTNRSFDPAKPTNKKKKGWFVGWFVVLFVGGLAHPTTTQQEHTTQRDLRKKS